jgi:hypothetical protein
MICRSSESARAKAFDFVMKRFGLRQRSIGRLARIRIVSADKSLELKAISYRCDSVNAPAPIFRFESRWQKMMLRSVTCGNRTQHLTQHITQLSACAEAGAWHFINSPEPQKRLHSVTPDCQEKPVLTTLIAQCVRLTHT